jgi:hypothetical protein
MRDYFRALGKGLWLMTILLFGSATMLGLPFVFALKSGHWLGWVGGAVFCLITFTLFYIDDKMGGI